MANASTNAISLLAVFNLLTVKAWQLSMGLVLIP